MPGDKETYLDYCELRGIDFSKNPLEVELSELSFGGLLQTQDNMETSIEGLYNGCLFFAFSGSMCGGYYAGLQAAEAALKSQSLPGLEEEEVMKERERVLKPLKLERGIGYKGLTMVMRV